MMQFSLKLAAFGSDPPDSTSLTQLAPKKPKSPLQRYRLLRKGKAVLS